MQPNVIKVNSSNLVRVLGNLNFHVLDAYNVIYTDISNINNFPSSTEKETKDYLAKNMTLLGYYTAALHGYKEGFWNRSVMYKAESFDDFYGESSYNIDDNVGMGLSDKSFLNQSLTKLKNFKQPYFSFLITLSSHYPYDDAKDYGKYGKFDAGEYANTFMGNYLEGIHYTDAQLGMFLDELQKEGILDNSIIVLYGDHFAIPKANIDLI